MAQSSFQTVPWIPPRTITVALDTSTTTERFVDRDVLLDVENAPDVILVARVLARYDSSGAAISTLEIAFEAAEDNCDTLFAAVGTSFSIKAPAAFPTDSRQDFGKSSVTRRFYRHRINGYTSSGTATALITYEILALVHQY
jgi:hypothetical protein